MESVSTWKANVFSYFQCEIWFWNKHLEWTHFSNIQKSLTNNEWILFISFFEVT